MYSAQNLAQQLFHQLRTGILVPTFSCIDTYYVRGNNFKENSWIL